VIGRCYYCEAPTGETRHDYSNLPLFVCSTCQRERAVSLSLAIVLGVLVLLGTLVVVFLDRLVEWWH
jgi:hypothetical protein